MFSNEFTETATYTPAGGAARGVAGIFDHVSEVSDIGAYIEADGVSATFDVATAQVAGVAYGDTVTVRGYAYQVVGIQPDGTGRTVLILGLAAAQPSVATAYGYEVDGAMLYEDGSRMLPETL